jgi:branched-chain amino acid transport system substrate-binding protein
MSNFLHRAIRTCFVVALSTAGLAGQAQDIVFAQVASHTNPASAANAKGLTLGIQVYFDKVNAGGGIRGRKLKLLTLDDALQGPKMVELTEQLVEDRSVVGLLGFLNTAGLNEIAKQDLPAKRGIALIAPLQGDRHVTGAGNVFPLRSGFADEVAALLKEAKTWDKDQLAVVNMNIGFGPTLAQVAIQTSKAQGIQVVTHQVLDATPDKLDASVAAAVAAVSSARPKGILILAAGKPAFDFIRAMRKAPGGATQMYGPSVLLHDSLVKAIGAASVRGMVLSQAVPYPFVPTKPVINEYHADMQRYAPSEPISFSTIEGYLGAKIAAEAVRRAGNQPNRETVLAALSNLGELNLGGIYVNYSPAKRQGWGGVDLSIVNDRGSLQK